MFNPAKMFQGVVLLAALLHGAAHSQSMPTPAPPVIGAKSYLVIDADSGHTLTELKPDEVLAPASLTKLMTAYVVFRALKEGQIGLQDPVLVSEKAWRTPGSRMFIEVGTRVTVEDLLLGMIVQSGNDASVALAEYVAGTEAVFAQMMNQYAAALGMRSSQFQNSTGLPDENHYSSARDLATLARAIINEFPDYYQWYSVQEFTYGDIKQNNRNALLWRDPSVDGMKTGHTDEAGYCLVSSAIRDDMRVISVVLGTASARSRIDGSQALLNFAFRFFETRRLYTAGEAVTQTRVWKAQDQTIQLGFNEDIWLTIPRGRFDDVQSSINIPNIVLAPLAAGEPVAELRLELDGEELMTTPLRALQDNPSGSLWQRTKDSVMLWFE